MKYKSIFEAELETKRKSTLDFYKTKQDFRVSVGKSVWQGYKGYNFLPSYNLREILNDEIVIEFDMKNWNKSMRTFQNEISWPAINLTAVNLYNAGISFEIWDHDGKSPHIHIHDLKRIKNLPADKRKLFKKIFIRNFVPIEYLFYADDSLTGISLIALENSKHWKGKYSVKKLLAKFNPNEK
jgi:hypothetical protein|tara:strand:+ start:2961 stop:3509 length:549 start_codon:yes stop_codon:yes gene_type:complete